MSLVFEQQLISRSFFRNTH